MGIPISQMVKANRRANVGSLQELLYSKTFRKRIMPSPSLAVACRRLGAPVRDWTPAPIVESKDPIMMTNG